MATDNGEQASYAQGQDCCRILMLTDEGEAAPNAHCGLQLESQTCADASFTCHTSAEVVERESSEVFTSSCSVSVDIEAGNADFSKINLKSGSVKTEIALTKPLRRQNSSQNGESMPPLMDHILMLLKFDPKEKQAIERVHDAANTRWRKYKRAASLDSRRVVLLFSILSCMGTMLLIFLTLRVRDVSDGYI